MWPPATSERPSTTPPLWPRPPSLVDEAMTTPDAPVAGAGGESCAHHRPTVSNSSAYITRWALGRMTSASARQPALPQDGRANAAFAQPEAFMPLLIEEVLTMDPLSERGMGGVSAPNYAEPLERRRRHAGCSLPSPN